MRKPKICLTPTNKNRGRAAGEKKKEKNNLVHIDRKLGFPNPKLGNETYHGGRGELKSWNLYGALCRGPSEMQFIDIDELFV